MSDYAPVKLRTYIYFNIKDAKTIWQAGIEVVDPGFLASRDLFPVKGSSKKITYEDKDSALFVSERKARRWLRRHIQRIKFLAYDFYLHRNSGGQKEISISLFGEVKILSENGRKEL